MKTLKKNGHKYLEEISQTFFFRNAGFGAVFLIIFAIFAPRLLLMALMASLISYVYTALYSTPKVLRDSGLVTVNGFFIGIALASMFSASTSFYVGLILGSLAVPLLTKAAYEVLQHWKLSPLIIPYILAVWVICLCAHRTQIEPHALPIFASLHKTPWPLVPRILAASFRSMSRLLFLDNPYFGISILALITLFSPRRGHFFFLGTLIATISAFLMSAGSHTWEYGSYGYSAGLIGLGLASFPEKFNWRTILFFCAISSILTIAMDEFLGELRLPLLSLPYVLTLWVSYLSRVPRLSLTWNSLQRTASVQASSYKLEGNSEIVA